MCLRAPIVRACVTRLSLPVQVDLILHPLRSELNWPLGPKVPLDLTEPAPSSTTTGGGGGARLKGIHAGGLRWAVAFALLDATYTAFAWASSGDDGNVTTRKRGTASGGVKSATAAANVPPPPRAQVVNKDLRESGAALRSLEELSQGLRLGLRTLAIQKSPHLVLLDPAFYRAALLRPLAAYAAAWLGVMGLGGCPDGSLANVLLKGSKASEGSWEDLKAGCDDRSLKLVLLTHEHLVSFVPHTLSKLNRVGFGLLTSADVERVEPRGSSWLQKSRRLLAVPFLALDSPSVRLIRGKQRSRVFAFCRGMRGLVKKRNGFSSFLFVCKRSWWPCRTPPYPRRHPSLATPRCSSRSR